MESIKCSAEAVDIYIFLPAALGVRAGRSQPRLQQQRFQDPAWILSPTLIPTTPRKQHTPFLSTGSSGAAVAESSSWMNHIPGSTISLSTAPGHHSANSLFCMPIFIQYMGRYKEEQECSHWLNFLFTLPASCLKKNQHRFPQINSEMSSIN